MKILQQANRLAPLTLFFMGASTSSHATLIINEKLTGEASSYEWQALGGACLTAGNGSENSTIPACFGFSYYKEKKPESILVGGDSGNFPKSRDLPGQGALRLTNGAQNTQKTNSPNQSGAIYSKFSFPSDQGVNITFKTVTYGGNKANNSCGDGIAFFLTDAEQVKSVNRDTALGAFGGSLGYSCTNSTSKTTVDGLYGAYIGIGIDEYGSFARYTDNTHQGASSLQKNYVTLKGAGYTNWKALNERFPQYYPSSVLRTDKQQQDAVRNTCKTGKLKDYSKSATAPKDVTQAHEFYNYPIIKTEKIVGDIFSEQALASPQRKKAKPITYNIKLTRNGKLSFSYSYNGGTLKHVITDQDISKDNGPIPKAFRFGFSASTGDASNVHEIMCFKAEPVAGSASNAAGNIPPEGSIQVGAYLYLASYVTQNWWGKLTAQKLAVDPKDGTVGILPQATWDANCVLTGGACNGQNTPAQATRRLLSWNDEAGIDFAFSNLSTAQKAALGADQSTASESLAKNYVQYLSGDRSLEIQKDARGTFRARDSLLGDIINSSPTWVGAPTSPYQEPWQDKLYPEAKAVENTAEGHSSYTDYKARYAYRTHVVYVGSNDGFLHGFRAGRINGKNDSLDEDYNDGREVMAYIPSQIIKSIGNPSEKDSKFKALNFGDPGYSHQSFVDATPGVGDLFAKGEWNTWLAGGLGAGGNLGADGKPMDVITDATTIGSGSIYVLNITDPDKFQETPAEGLIVGEWNAQNISCINDTSTSKCADSLGNIHGTPLIRRLHNGHWGIIFPNGWNSKSGKSGIFILLIDSATGEKRFQFIPAGSPSPATGTIKVRNGMSHVTAADLDEDNITDYVYAGDLSGNVWRFDLTSQSESDWHVRSAPIFNAHNRPISTSVLVGASHKDQVSKVILNFGTGRIYPNSTTQSSQATSGPHHVYGVWDADMADWNDKVTDSIRYEFIRGASTVPQSSLVQQTITQHDFNNKDLGISGARTVSDNPVCWKKSTLCRDGNNDMGWYMKLPDQHEQIVYSPRFSHGFFIFNTTVPRADTPLSCETKDPTGYTMALLPDTGSTPESSFFKNTKFSGGDDARLAGLGLDGVGTPLSVDAIGRSFHITQTAEGVGGKVIEVDASLNFSAQRLSWTRRR